MSQTRVGLAASRPGKPLRGRRYIALDTNQEWVGDGTEWIETTGDGGGGGGPAAPSHEVVAIMRVKEAQNSVVGGESKVGPVLTIPGDGERWARVELHVPEIVATIPAGVTPGQLTIAVASPDLSIVYQDDYARFPAQPDVDSTYGFPWHLLGLIPPWEGDIEMQVSVWKSGAWSSRVGAQDDPVYSQAIEMTVTMFDAPAIQRLGLEVDYNAGLDRVELVLDIDGFFDTFAPNGSVIATIDGAPVTIGPGEYVKNDGAHVWVNAAATAYPGVWTAVSFVDEFDAPIGPSWAGSVTVP